MRVTSLLLVAVTVALVMICTTATTSVEAKRSHGCGGSVGSAGEFDLFVFQQSWSAEFCQSKNFPGCDNPTPFMQTNLTIHGLWPQYAAKKDGRGWPQCCESKYGTSLNETVIGDLKSALTQMWPVEQGGEELWQHEWVKHGTCSGLSQMAYFKAALGTDQAIGTPAVIANNIGGTVKKSDLLDYYNIQAQLHFKMQGRQFDSQAQYVSLSCSGDFLGSITTCYDKTLTRTACRGLEASSCGDSIRINSFN
jgi:ribonuclease I